MDVPVCVRYDQHLHLLFIARDIGDFPGGALLPGFLDFRRRQTILAQDSLLDKLRAIIRLAVQPFNHPARQFERDLDLENPGILTLRATARFQGFWQCGYWHTYKYIL